MIPMVFCASLPPWLTLSMAEDTSCRRLNHLSTRPGVTLRKSQEALTASIDEAR